MNYQTESDLAWETFGSSQPIMHKIGTNLYQSICKIQGKEQVQKYKKEEGTYITFFSPTMLEMDDVVFGELAHCIANELRQMLIKHVTVPSCDRSVLVVGLGNPFMTVDSLGPETVKNIRATRNHPQKTNDSFSISTLTPNVGGCTGIESIELIQATVEQIHPQAIITIDSLSAGSCERLASTVQLTDAGISPGSGGGRTHGKLNASTVGIPVFSLGIPTIVRSTNLLIEALKKGRMTDITPQMKEMLENHHAYFIMPRELDLVIKSGALLLSSAINQLCLREGEYSSHSSHTV